MELQKTWMVEIDFKINAFNPDVTVNMLQLQKLNDDNSVASGQHGIKTPQGFPDLIFYCKNLSFSVVILRTTNRLRICSTVGDNINYCFFWQALDLNQWYSLKISQERDDSGVYSNIFVQ